MNVTLSNNKSSINKAENEYFSWSVYDGSDGGSLIHKATGKEIYQMHWCDGPRGTMHTPVTGEVREQALAFWNELWALQKKQEEIYNAAIRERETFDYAEPKHGYRGYCRKCHSYCWGDCEANNA